MAGGVNRPAPGGPSAGERLGRATFLLGWVPLAGLLGLSLLGVTVPVTVGYGALLATLVVLGLPHGALDHLTVPWARGEAPTLGFLARFSLAYLAVAGAYAAVWWAAPTLAFVAFLLVTWYHWGQGDCSHLLAFTDGRHLGGRAGRAGTILVRGGLPMVVPLLAFPERYRAVAETVVGLFGASPAALAPLVRPDVRLAAGAGLAALTLATLAGGYRRAVVRRSWAVDAGETLGLWAYFAVVPPVLAIGLYFAVWHSARHLARLIALDGAVGTADGADPAGALARLARDALPTTLGALALFGLLALAVPRDPGSLAGLAGVYLVVLAVLTAPHALVVTWLDRRQGVWDRTEL